MIERARAPVGIGQGREAAFGEKTVEAIAPAADAVERPAEIEQDCVEIAHPNPETITGA